MKALVYDGPRTLSYKEVADPPTEMTGELIRVEAVGICGSDMHAYLGHDSRRPAPLILGHEAAGTIEGGPRAGERVTINPLVTCGICPACQAGRENLCPERQIISMPPREGAFAQYVSMPSRNLTTVPENVPLEQAALAEPLAVSWHAARLALSALPEGGRRDALVIGGGAIGVAAVLALRAMGVDRVVIAERNEARQDFLSDICGFDVVDSPQGDFAVVIDAVGLSVTRALASALACPGGVIAHIGLGEDRGGLDIRRITLQEIQFIGTYTYTDQDFRDTASAIFAGRLGPLDWFEKRPLAEGARAFKDLNRHAVSAPKIILTPWA
ncbi:zinc-dependent alcohol dehydrogenase [Primorskyibacter sp. S87]|uniref:zinc-dependent alcohol dehydrogenase n=1 Tax=Primorskyibacter sp. S87 TaxID=3415126 RepID=UPI003C7BC245